MLRLKSLSLLLLCLFALIACKTEIKPEEKPEDDIAPIAEESVPPSSLEEPEEIIWGLYEGKLGLYESQVVLALEIQGEAVSGNYFYAKHQKTLSLEGTYDPSSGMVKATESYKGKTTGYLEFKLSHGEIEGRWMKQKDAQEKEDFTATLIDLSEEDYSAKHGRYKDVHKITLFSGEDDYEEEVTDVLTISEVGGGFFSFYYSVIGANAHIGSVEGFAKRKGDTGIFRDLESCELTFTFSGNTVEVHETGDCQYYRGARAYFEGVLSKVN